MNNKNLYETLGVKPDATEEDIKKAYRTKARRAHPDRKGGNADEFKAISVAYEVLVDPVRRSRYEETGDTDNSQESRVRMLVGSMLLEAFLESDNPIQFITSRLNSLRLQHREAKTHIDQTIRKLRRQITKFKEDNADTKNKDSRDFILEVLETNLLNVESNLIVANAQVTFSNEAIAYLNDLRWNRATSTYGTAEFRSPVDWQAEYKQISDHNDR